MVTRIYVIARDRGPILLSNAASQWLGLITVPCENKAPVVGRFIAGVTREETDGGEIEVYHIPATDGPEMTESKKTPLTERAIKAPRNTKLTKKAKHMPSAPLDVNPRTTHSESQPSVAERTKLNTLQEQNSVQSGEAG